MLSDQTDNVQALAAASDLVLMDLSGNVLEKKIWEPAQEHMLV